VSGPGRIGHPRDVADDQLNQMAGNGQGRRHRFRSDIWLAVAPDDAQLSPDRNQVPWTEYIQQMPGATGDYHDHCVGDMWTESDVSLPRTGLHQHLVAQFRMGLDLPDQAAEAK